jgi:hypothetical protein
MRWDRRRKDTTGAARVVQDYHVTEPELWILHLLERIRKPRAGQYEIAARHVRVRGADLDEIHLRYFLQAK